MEDRLDQIIREKKFENNIEQIRNFITHCLGFQPEDMIGGEFANDFTWKTKNAELNITFYQGCTWKDEKDSFWYILRILPTFEIIFIKQSVFILVLNISFSFILKPK